MATTKKTQADDAPQGPQPMPVPEGGWPPDEFTGKGGNYVRDPFTGVRSRAIEPEAAAAAPGDSAEPPETPVVA
jgi:hypothetical protein